MNNSCKLYHPARRALLCFSVILLAGCNTIVLNPAGDIAQQQGRLLLVSTLLMLLIIVPVLFLIGLFAWKYRKGNASTEAQYSPEWDHSTSLELIIWGAPLLIIIVLGLLTWISTHTLDPYRKLSRLDENRPLPANVKTLRVEVVALDWKWLFIYPDLGIASVNELAAPVDVPIEFKITASSVMNSFYIPALAGQIYAMPGMQTTLNAVINHPGSFEGFSANYSGAGFSDMKFKFHGLSQAEFDHWVQTFKASAALDRSVYADLEKPSIREPIRHYGVVDASLYHAILNRCVSGDAMCMDKMMTVDANSNKRAAMNIDPLKLTAINTEVCTTTPSLQDKQNARAN